MERRRFFAVLPVGVGALLGMGAAPVMTLSIARDPAGAVGGWINQDGTRGSWREIEEAYRSVVIGEEHPKAGIVKGELVSL